MLQTTTSSSCSRYVDLVIRYSHKPQLILVQRLKGFNLDSFLDSKIAEEQARQKGGQPSGTSRTPSQARRGGRTDSPSKRTASSSNADKLPPGKGPDPSEFVIEDDEALSRAATPKPTEKEGDESQQEAAQPPKSEDDKKDGDDGATSGKILEKRPVTDDADELPQEVQLKLRKLQKLESRYHDLLRSYRIAHTRVSAIEPFETALREHTPLASIAEPSAMIEYLSQINLKGEMVMDELKRVSGDRDSLKVKLEGAEKKLKEAHDEAAGLRKEREAQAIEKESAGKAKDPSAEKDGDNDFFSYEDEMPRLQEELEEQSRKVETLTEENAALKKDLEEARSSHEKLIETNAESAKTQGDVNDKVESRGLDLQQRLDDSEKAMTAAKESFNQAVSRLELTVPESTSLANRIQKLGELVRSAESVDSAVEKQVKDLTARSEKAEQALTEYETKHKALEKSTADSSSADKKKIDTLDGLVKSMRGQIQDAEKARKSSESDLSGLRKKLAEAEEQRDLADKATKQAPEDESALTQLREQLSQAQRDRDDAFQILVDSGLADVVEVTSETPASNNADGSEAKSNPSQPVAVSEEPAKAESVGAKKKSKKKKKKATESSANTAEKADQETTAKTEEEPKSQETSTPDVSNIKVSKLTEVQLAAIRRHVGKTHSHESCEAAISELRTKIATKEEELQTLSRQIKDKEGTIDRLTGRLKGEEDLLEEIEGLKDDLMHVGNEHVGAKDRVKTLSEEKQRALEEHTENLKQVEDRCASLKEKCSRLEADLETKGEEHRAIQAELDTHKTSSGSSAKDLEEKLATVTAEKQELEDKLKAHEQEIDGLKNSTASSSAEAEKKHEGLVKELDETKSQTSSLQTDLSAANELAQTRYKDLTALKEHLNKLQPELNSAKKEIEQLKKTNGELKAGSDKLRQLESRSESLKSEIAGHKTKVQEKEAEVKTLNEKLKGNNERIADLEEKERSLTKVESLHKEASDARDKTIRELEQTKAELTTSRKKIHEFEKQATDLRGEADRAKEEVQLKSAQQASAQSLMDSMQDQTRELATQMKEVRERCESLEEELADAHRLLSERSREGETMRRLLSDVEGRADARVKEMRERMDLAMEERDRAEDEASAAGRRRARELEELRIKLKDAEKQRAAAIEEKEAFEKKESGFQSHREGLERRAAQAQEELAEVRTAMTQLRDALDEGERQSRETEKERAELKRLVDDKEKRLEKLQKGSKTMADELRTLQNMKTHQPSISSSRSSIESSRITSPARPGAGHVATTGGPDAQPATDYVYLKNVLLQFMEQKDKKHQMQLVPVLGMLLHFDK